MHELRSASVARMVAQKVVTRLIKEKVMANLLKAIRQANKTRTWHLAAMIAGATLIYYAAHIFGLFGWSSTQNFLLQFHEAYSLAFFAPVVYAAYVYGVGSVVLVTLLTMLIIFPYAIFISPKLPYSIIVAPFSGSLLAPAALGLVLSAVGAAIAMLQRSDEQRQRRMREIQCLYEVGRAAEETKSVNAFLNSVTDIVRNFTKRPADCHVRIRVRDVTVQDPGYDNRSGRTAVVNLFVGGTNVGDISIRCPYGDTSLEQPFTFFKALADRVGGAIRRIELEQSLQRYSERLEEMVGSRTQALEEARDKLVRSERLAAVGELASGVGHELRNPLNVIRNCVYLMNLSLGESADEETRDTLKLLDKQVDISNRIVTDLLDFTRVRTPTLSAVDLNALVKESMSWVVVPDGISVVTDFVPQAPSVVVDAEQIGRVFVNIFANGLQSIKGEGEIKVVTGARNGHAWVSVKDSGCGIPADNMQKIFEPLFTTKRKGIGLGLAIARRLTEQNGGTIEVLSEPLKGSTFTIKLPTARPGKA